MASRREARENGTRDGTDAVGAAFQLVAQGLAQLQEALRLQKQEDARQAQEALRLQEEAERRTKEALNLQERRAATALRELERKLQEKDDAIRALQERLEETQESVTAAEERRTEVLRLQEERAATALREMERKLQEKDDAIRALQERLQETQERIAAVEGRTAVSEGSAGEGGLQRLQGRVEAVEASLQRAIQTFLPRVDVLLSQLEQPRTTCASLATAVPTSSAWDATMAGGAVEGGGKGSPPSDHFPAPTPTSSAGHQGEESHERQQLMSRVKAAMLRIEKARTSPTPLGEKLCQAVEDGRLSAVRRLIDSGADVDYFDGNGSNPLLRAVCSGDVDVVSLLLQRGANVNVVNDCGNSALHWDVSEGRCGLCVDLLVGAGGDVDARNMEGESPLHYAAHFGNENAVRTLLAAGARKDLKVWCGEWKGKTAFDLAASPAVEDLLRGRNSDEAPGINTRCPFRNTTSRQGGVKARIERRGRSAVGAARNAPR